MSASGGITDGEKKVGVRQTEGRQFRVKCRSHTEMVNMSHKVTRKGPIGDESKKHSDSPVKEMKKKMAANAEKEKQAADKDKTAEKTNLNEKQTEKTTQNDKSEKKDKSTDKVDKTEKKDKPTDKVVEKIDKKDKSADTVVEKAVDKKTDKTEKKDKVGDKSSDKKEKPAEKKEAPVAPVEKPKEDTKENGKSETSDKQKKETPKAKQNGARMNGEPVDGTVSSEEEDDQMFPELAYEDSDVEYFEPPTPEGPSRSYTRRSQVKSSRTPETPRPASDKQADKDYVPEDSKESKLLKLKDDLPTDRKLRSSDSPKPQDKSEEDKEKDESGRDKTESAKDKLDEGRSEDKLEFGIAIEVEIEEGARKPDTNYSKSRVKVSPYRRSGRLADQTQTSLLANYTGNNTTMEMDITESSTVLEESSNVESPYLSGLRSIRGRRSYKPLKEMTLRNIGVNTSIRSTASASDTSARPTGTVVGRKRKPESADTGGDGPHADAPETRGKRAKLLERLGGLARPFRFTSAAADRLCVESAAEIVGINTDLPLTAPVAAAGTFDPESIKHSTPLPARPAPSAGPASTAAPSAGPASTAAHSAGPAPAHRDKRCSIM